MYSGGDASNRVQLLVATTNPYANARLYLRVAATPTSWVDTADTAYDDVGVIKV